MCVFLSLICSESSEYSDWTEEVGLRTQQQTENRRPRRVCRVLSTSEEEGAEPSSAAAAQPGPSSPQRQSKAKKESKKSKKPTKKKRVRNALSSIIFAFQEYQLTLVFQVINFFLWPVEYCDE